MLTSEVKAWTPYRRNGGPPATEHYSTAAEASTVTASGTEFKEILQDNLQWPDGRVHHEGFTTTLPPNTRVPCVNGTTTYDCDYNSWQEGKNGTSGSPSYAIITSRSYHVGVVQVAMVDGSSKSISENIDLGACAAWELVAVAKSLVNSDWTTPCLKTQTLLPLYC